MLVNKEEIRKIDKIRKTVKSKGFTLYDLVIFFSHAYFLTVPTPTNTLLALNVVINYIITWLIS